ncbi:GlxA family transcriptional regulator [Paraburkholderia sp.]|uniref:GlxA family transcriptional regulator n=1 Tax=Paraburkholderia sp. TaxID=1926495 RepID=UPI0039E40DCE
MEPTHTSPSGSRFNAATRMRPGATTRVDIVLFNGFELPEVAVLIEIFSKANALAVSQGSARARYDISLLSSEGGRIASSSSVFVWTDDIDSHRGTNDTHLMFIAGGAGVQQACRDERLRNWLRHRHQFSKLVHPVEEGRLLLEAAGLSTRYWSLPDSDGGLPERQSAPARKRAPAVVRTALHIVEHDLSPELAGLVAESVLPQPRTPFSSFMASGKASQVSEKIMASARWLDANVDRPISIDEAARLAAMSERNFLRRFKNEIGMTPSDYLLRSRLNLSCRMLVESRLPIDKIARLCGIGNGSQLSKLFRKYLATTPTEYRLSNTASSGRINRRSQNLPALGLRLDFPDAPKASL